MLIWSVKTRPKPGFASFAARSFSGVGCGAGWMSNVTLMALLSAVETGAISGAGLTSASLPSRFRADLSNETSMDLLPAEEARFGAVYYAGPLDARLAVLADAFARCRSPVCCPTRSPDRGTVDPDRGSRCRGRPWRAISEHRRRRIRSKISPASIV